MTWTFASLAQSNHAQLEQVLASSPAPSFASLVGYEFRGFNVLAAVAKPVGALMGIQRFAKGFFVRNGEAYADGACGEGYNMVVKSGTINDPWNFSPSNDAPKRHSFFRCYPPGAGAQRNGRYPQALFLDYSLANPKNGLFDGDGLRDFVVQPEANNPDLILGKAFFALGPLTVVGGFFVAERLQKAAVSF